MKKNLFTLLICLSVIQAFAQLDIVDRSEDPKLESIKYHGDFMTLDGVYKDEVISGLVGEKVTLIDVSYYLMYENKQALEDMKSVSSKEEGNFQNQTFDIVDFYKSGSRTVLVIKNEQGTYHWLVSGKYVFNKFIDVVRQKVEGRTYVPLHIESEFMALSGREFNIVGSKTYTVTKVRFAKLKFDYGIVLEINGDFECVYPTGLFGQPMRFNGQTYEVDGENWINIKGSPASLNSFGSIKLVEQKAFEAYSAENSSFITEIRNRKVKVGMTESQCSDAWGAHSKTLRNVGGFDKVFTNDGGKSLYFKDGILKLIK